MSCLLGFISTTIKYQCEIEWTRCLLLPELWEDAATELHPFQRLFCDLHVLVDGVHAGLDLFELLCARTNGVIFAGIKILRLCIRYNISLQVRSRLCVRPFPKMEAE